jgi:mannosyltransferase OCH1-like enzyme
METSQGGIPRIIHQVWFDIGNGKTVPKRFDRHCESWRKFHSSYEFRLWSKEDADKFIKEKYNHLYGVYRRYKQEINRIDMIRYCFLHYYGGVYVDCDCECFQSIDPLLEKYDAILYYEKAICALNNNFIACVPGHPIIEKCLLEIAGGDSSIWNHSDTSVGVLVLTGPLVLMRASYAYPNSFYLIPEGYFYHESAKTWTARKGLVSDAIFIIFYAILTIFLIFFLLYGVRKYFYPGIPLTYRFVFPLEKFPV